MTNSRLIRCHARVFPSPDQNGKSLPDRSKLLGSHGQRRLVWRLLLSLRKELNFWSGWPQEIKETGTVGVKFFAQRSVSTSRIQEIARGHGQRNTFSESEAPIGVGGANRYRLWLCSRSGFLDGRLSFPTPFQFRKPPWPVAWGARRGDGGFSWIRQS